MITVLCNIFRIFRGWRTVFRAARTDEFMSSHWMAELKGRKNADDTFR
jgi:hypothetical protein